MGTRRHHHARLCGPGDRRPATARVHGRRRGPCLRPRRLAALPAAGDPPGHPAVRSGAHDPHRLRHLRPAGNAQPRHALDRRHLRAARQQRHAHPAPARDAAGQRLADEQRARHDQPARARHPAAARAHLPAVDHRAGPEHRMGKPEARRAAASQHRRARTAGLPARQRLSQVARSAQLVRRPVAHQRRRRQPALEPGPDRRAAARGRAPGLQPGRAGAAGRHRRRQLHPAGAAARGRGTPHPGPGAEHAGQQRERCAQRLLDRQRMGRRPAQARRGRVPAGAGSELGEPAPGQRPAGRLRALELAHAPVVGRGFGRLARFDQRAQRQRLFRHRLGALAPQPRPHAGRRQHRAPLRRRRLEHLRRLALPERLGHQRSAPGIHPRRQRGRFALVDLGPGVVGAAGLVVLHQPGCGPLRSHHEPTLGIGCRAPR